MTPCPNCQTANPPGSAACVTCGFPLAQAAPDAVPQQPQQQPPPQQPPVFQPPQQPQQQPPPQQPPVFQPPQQPQQQQAPQQPPVFQPPQQQPPQQAPSAAPWEQNAPPPFVPGAAAAAAADASVQASAPQAQPVYTLPTQATPDASAVPTTPWTPGSIPEYKPQEAGTAIPEDMKIGGFAEETPPDSRTTKILIGVVLLLLVGAFFTFQGMPAREKKADTTTTTKAGDEPTAGCQTTGTGAGETCITGLPTVTFDPPNGWNAAPATSEGGGSGVTFTAPDEAQAISVVGAPTAAVAAPFAAQPRTGATPSGQATGIAYRTTRPGSTLPVYVAEGKSGTVVVEMVKAPNQNGSDPVATKNFDAVVASLSKVP